MELIFTQDYSPREKGDVVNFETREELQIANFYLSNGIAHLKSQGCGCGCSGEEDCLEKANEEVVETVAKPTKKSK